MERLKLKNFFCTMLTLVVLVSYLAVNVAAVEKSPNENNSFVVMRAAGKFDTDVPGNTAVKVGSSFPLEVGEVVTIKATYSPFSASVDIGLIAPDGLKEKQIVQWYEVK